MTAVDYPITTPFGQVPGYELNGGFHRGVDRAMPTGTQVVVNGVVIGLSGSTGASTGPHLHLGKWVGSTPLDPTTEGFTLDGAVVAQIGYDSTNGNFVAINAEGARWVYLHLSEIKVKVGDKLEGENMPSVVDRELSGELLTAYFTPEQIAAEGGETFIQSWVGTESNSMIKALYESPQFRNKRLDAENNAKIVADGVPSATELKKGLYEVK